MAIVVNAIDLMSSKLTVKREVHFQRPTRCCDDRQMSAQAKVEEVCPFCGTEGDYQAFYTVYDDGKLVARGKGNVSVFDDVAFVMSANAVAQLFERENVLYTEFTDAPNA